ncbi:MAG: SRPBCC family protein [Pseudomonadota bacterium]
MQIARTLQIKAPLEKVWSILADDYATIGEWARAVERSAANPDAAPPPGAAVGGRVCTANIGDVTETITTFDPKHHVLAYSAQAKAMPFFVRGLTGRWTLNAVKGGTRVDLGFKADLMPPFGTLMGWAMKRQFVAAIDDTLEDLKLWAETGEVHPDKAKALAA